MLNIDDYLDKINFQDSASTETTELKLTHWLTLSQRKRSVFFFKFFNFRANGKDGFETTFVGNLVYFQKI